jgi:1-acyl-sn-glycerol-3-phosphate acyltransferase
LHHVPLQRGAAAPARWDQKALRLLVRTVFRLLFRVRVVGLDNIPPTPVIICANHLGWADPFLILLFFPAEPRIYVLGMEAIYESAPLVRRLLDWLQILVALDPAQPQCAARAMEEMVARGGRLLVFPEGRLGDVEGRLQSLHPGAAHAALHNHVPLLPVGLTGTHELWLRRPLTMRIGPPIAPATTQGPLHERAAALTERLAAAMQTLLPGDAVAGRRKPLCAWLTQLDRRVAPAAGRDTGGR